MNKNKNVWERMKDNNSMKKFADFTVKQQMDHEFKVNYAYKVAWEFIEETSKLGLDTYVSVGGLDSLTLYAFLKDIGIKVPAVSVSHIEHKSIQEIHKKLGVICCLPAKRRDGTRWSKTSIINECGFPIGSKEISQKIATLQHPTERNKTSRHAIITGECGAYGGNKKESRMKLSQRWLNKFGGYENENEGVNYEIPDFKVSSKCCNYLKEKPCKDWAKKNNAVPFMGLMASEGGRRSKTLKLNGCNYYGVKNIRSAPFAIFNRQDILQLALDLNVEVPSVYGTIERKEDGTLYTTKAQRTGCSMCGYGVHLEKRPHRFDLLRKDNYKEWKYWMYDCYTSDSGEKFGYGHVLDYIGVKWEDDIFVDKLKK